MQASEFSQEYEETAKQDRHYIEEFEHFEEMDIYVMLCSMAKSDEDAAIEILINTDDPNVAEVQRKIIARCRYFNQWALSLKEALFQSTIDYEPPR